jgi:hypothetical protein
VVELLAQPGGGVDDLVIRSVTWCVVVSVYIGAIVYLCMMVE